MYRTKRGPFPFASLSSPANSDGLEPVRTVTCLAESLGELSTTPNPSTPKYAEPINCNWVEASRETICARRGMLDLMRDGNLDQLWQNAPVS